MGLILPHSVSPPPHCGLELLWFTLPWNGWRLRGEPRFTCPHPAPFHACPLQPAAHPHYHHLKPSYPTRPGRGTIQPYTVNAMPTPPLRNGNAPTEAARFAHGFTPHTYPRTRSFFFTILCILVRFDVRRYAAACLTRRPTDCAVPCRCDVYVRLTCLPCGHAHIKQQVL